MSPPSLGKLGFQETAGRRWRPASWTISLWCTSVMKVSVGRISPPFGAPAKLSKAGSMSALERTGTAVACTPSVGAAASIDRMKNLDCGDVSGLNMTPMRASPGAISLSNSSHLPPIENSYALKPVRLPPGFATLATKPCATGSETCVNTTGGAGCLLDGLQVGRGGGQNDVWHQSDQLRRVDACELGIAGVPANIHADVLAFGPS